MTARRLVVWRHGETAYNAEGRMQGQTDVVLNDVGELQAKGAARLLATLQPAAIVASDLSRAVSTAAALAEITGLGVTHDPDLREIHCGAWEGMLRRDVAARWPEELARDEAGQCVRRGGDGETSVEVAERFERGLRRAAEAGADDETVVVAGHGLAGGVGAAKLVGLAPPRPGIRGLRNCHWATLVRDRLGWQIVEWNVGAWPEPV